MTLNFVYLLNLMTLPSFNDILFEIFKCFDKHQTTGTTIQINRIRIETQHKNNN